MYDLQEGIGHGLTSGQSPAALKPYIADTILVINLFSLIFQMDQGPTHRSYLERTLLRLSVCNAKCKISWSNFSFHTKHNIVLNFVL